MRQDRLQAGLFRYVTETEKSFDTKGQEVASTTRKTTYDGAGRRLLIDYQAPSYFKGSGGLSLNVKKLAYNLAESKADFELAYENLQWIEKGSLFNVSATSGGDVAFDPLDPLQYYSGNATVTTAAGKTLFSIEQPSVISQAGQMDLRTYRLEGDLSVYLARRSPSEPFAGVLTVNDTTIGEAKLQRGTDGSVTFIVTSELFDKPLVIGYGAKGVIKASVSAASTPAPAPSSDWMLSTAAGSGVLSFMDGDEPLKTQFNLPAGTLLDGDTLYVADQSNQRIRQLTLSSTTHDVTRVATFAGKGTLGADDGARLEATFSSPTALAKGADGTLYVTEIIGNRVRAISPSGQVTTLAGSGEKGAQDGKGAQATFNNPAGIAVGPDNTVYVADSFNHLIRRIAPDGTVATLAGDGTEGFADGVGRAAKFAAPLGIALGPDGDLYVADNGNGRIRRVTTAGVVTTYAGSGTQLTFDGPLASATMPRPAGLAFDGLGNMYVSDLFLTSVRRISTAGEVQTVAGGIFLARGAYASDGVLGGAQLSAPLFFTVDPTGRYGFVPDKTASRIRRMTFGK